MSDQQLSITRFIDAPPETVYRVFTERTAEYWCPRPWTTPAVDWDLRAGGRMYTEMKGPDGEGEGGEGVFLEVVPNQRIVFTNALTPGWDPQVQTNEGCDFAMVGTFTFAPEGSGTRYTASARHWSAEAVARHRDMGFEQGWSMVAEQLAEIAEAQARGRAAA